MTAGAVSTRLEERLADIVGAPHVLSAADLRRPYETDWTGRFRGEAALVVRPADAGEVAEVVGACADFGVPIIPQGGNTGLVGGTVPSGGEVIVNLARLDQLEPVDEVAAEVTVGAGVTLARLQEHARAVGLSFGVDLAARDSATVGGMIATNAGGIHVMRHGSMRGQLVGIEAVLADGRVVRRLPGLARDNVGYDLPGLLAGSEGTLAIVTRARLRLTTPARSRVTALLGLADTAAALELLSPLRRGLPLEAVEIFYRDGLELVCEHAGGIDPFREPHGAYLLVEAAGRGEPMEELAAVVEGRPEVEDVAVATDPPGARRLWQLREAHTEAINAAGIPHKLDVAVPLPRLAALERGVRELVGSRGNGARAVLFGHFGDGNLHVNVLGVPPDDDTVDDAVLRLVVELGGSIAAEHGVGRAKTRWVHLSRGDADVAAMRAVKRALDPHDILNPGVLFDVPG